MPEKPTTPQEYLATVPQAARGALEEVRTAIREALPEAVETISYGILGYRLGGRVVAYCAGWQEHVSLYPVPRGDQGYAARAAAYVAGRGTLRFPLSAPVPLDLVRDTVVGLAAERGLLT